MVSEVGELMTHNDKHEPEKKEQEQAAAPPPPPPEPYPQKGYPKVVFNKAGSAPPRIVNNDAELAKLDAEEWTQIPPVESKEANTWPRPYYNINSPLRMVASRADADALGMNWRDLEHDFGVTVARPNPPAK